MANAHAHTEIRDPGPFDVGSGVKGFFGAIAAIGFVVFLIGLKSDPQRAWASFLQNHFYFMSLAIGGMFFAAIQWVTGAMWSAPIRRISESLTSYLPVAIITFIALGFGLKSLYIWTDPSVVSQEIVLQGKAGYLNPTFFMVRNLIALVLWVFFAWKMVGNSVSQDATKDPSFTARNKMLGPGFLIIFAITFTMASFDQLMSLDPRWYSTMFGVYCFAGLFYSTLAATCLIALYLRSKGRLDGIMNDNHLHDLGKFMFAFTIFWAYIGFSQFMLIWYANLPEEILYFQHRFQGSWLYVSIFLLVGKFMTPFFLLLPRESKRKPTLLMVAAVFMLVAQWVDVLWMVQPEFSKSGPHIGITEIGTALGFLGIFGFVVTRFLGKHSVVAIGDPRLAESVFHHHQ